ncbi:hypothetical protein H112_08855 [Trichophyton rubrum D6]|uniref:Sphingomyelinase D n=3 Tax=Trichophyton rubrum TaxID=5551 RepID=SMD_TRIRC|nr:uncharacterized protein TERG_01406 [Trichophyton rubrum CBS 118892]F2SCC4.1 RecName: Full=Sphingomyelinase D; Short=SMase D; Flags: Precursor [Trichophyton rubrum CBS 118892]EZF09832.1 hypothetical protein H100_08876 [Trichophyton rubrum MR850]EZF36694.1 hypothetical protein H102_08837 [Trichophyton rubrum CBS 100081]EZF47286.1 hypothetical protein H103_08859 [Trichophyton rubrum CBS 288.86]EZF58024.1 hypothetical protein H104_08807 [Trichophyton rubrum CBS 289.86]EZF79242.1 hypothetical p
MISLLRLCSFLAAGSILVQGSPIIAPSAPTWDTPNNFTSPSNFTSKPGNEASPFWLIGHRVLTKGGVRAALGHGANALEVDITGWWNGWYGDHDGLPSSAGDKVADLFDEIAYRRRQGAQVSFVWLDLKNPDFNKNGVNIVSLMTLCREKLEPAGVRVLFGFYSSQTSGHAFRFVKQVLNENEAIGIDGSFEPVEKDFEKNGIRVEKRVFSSGLFNPDFNFGTCQDRASGVCTQLREGKESHKFGKVFGWTVSSYTRKDHVYKMMEVGVDGLIYGFVASHYYNHKDIRQTIRTIRGWLDEHRDTHRLATNDDNPWSMSSRKSS